MPNPTLQSILTALPGGYLLLDAQLRVSFVTQRFELLLQAPPLAVGQALPDKLLPPAVMQQLRLPAQEWSLQLFHGGTLLDWLLTPLPDGLLLSVREDRQAFRTLVENSPDIISRYDTDLVCLYVNSALARYSPLPPLYHVGLGIADRGLPAGMCDAMQHAAHQVLASGQPYTFETEISRPERHLVFEARLLPETDENGTLQSLLCIERDITEKHANRMWQADENRLLEMLANDRPLPEVMDWTCRMLDSHIPGAMNSIMLLQPDNEHLQVVAGPGLPDAYKASIDGIAIGEGVGSCGTAVARARPVIVEDIMHDPLWAPYIELVRPFALRACWSHPIMAYDGRVLGTFATYFAEPRSPQPGELNIIQRTSHLMAIAIQQERRASQLFQLATMDALTGLINRRHFMELAGKAFQDARHSGKPLSLLMLDLDHFKSVNDRFGHEAGDDVLQLFARLLRDGLRGSDLICRMGGEEFAALLPAAGLDEAAVAAQRICKAVAGSSVPHPAQPIEVTVSIGVCSLDGVLGSLGDMIRQADKALYQAKNEGRNRVCLAHDD
ncbi:diguanylate cyclase [Vogesella sp. LIG4]|uniref:diguanylate cyclase n=1 Tax=Vogesella sp. LIG4 TaxID=1192162 RepID=UPI0008200F9E|nr:diguanylate cyclase [Vogesella sp. LIG4]SCK15038.1 PAS domain S-box-containing protein/diguanylate cyclase (GGDEF) domain-containing protein [Vogesella sp. LIG4]